MCIGVILNLDKEFLFCNQRKKSIIKIIKASRPQFLGRNFDMKIKITHVLLSQKFKNLDIDFFLIACKLPQEYQKQPVECRNKRLEAVRLFGVFHDFLCMAGGITDISEPVPEIGCKKLLQVTRECMLEINRPDRETEIKTSSIGKVLGSLQSSSIWDLNKQWVFKFL